MTFSANFLVLALLLFISEPIHIHKYVYRITERRTRAGDKVVITYMSLV
jgi:hypothetical protein